MIRLPPISTRTDTLFPYTTLFRSTRCNGGTDRGFHPAERPRCAQGLQGADAQGGRRRHARSAARYRWPHRQYPREPGGQGGRSEEHTSELPSLMRISYAVFCLKKKNNTTIYHYTHRIHHNK